jgi:hypothetical protein
MTSDSELEFRRLVRARLGELDESLTRVLEKLITHKYPNEVVAVDFELFSDGFTSGFPVRAYLVDQTNSEFFVCQNGREEYPSPVDPELLEIECVYPDEAEDQLTSADPEADPWHLASCEFFEWFLACWRKAGGRYFPLAATIAHHDSSTEINLINGETQTRWHRLAPYDWSD